MEKNSKILIAGAAGMVGSAIIRKLLELGFTNILGSYHRQLPDISAITLNKEVDHIKNVFRLVQLDLTIQPEAERFFKAEKPEYVFMAAARVGGIHANNTYPAQFIYENLSMQNNMIHEAFKSKVNRLLFLGSSCIYPKLAPQPMHEKHLLAGPLEPTNEPYAIAKIAGIKMCESYNRQYGTRFVSVMPTNLYGPNDNFDLENSHVLPALMRKFHEAKSSGKKEVVIWGTGTPRREFLHVDDLADATVFVMNLDDDTLADHLLSYPKPCFVNVGSGVDGTILEMASTIKEIIGYSGDLIFDHSKPDGVPQKLLDTSKLSQLGWQHKISLKNGIRDVYNWYRSQSANLRIPGKVF
jgi:GDP-L-fucose synthase